MWCRFVGNEWLCTIRCIMLNYYDLGLLQVGLKSLVISVDYWTYMGSSLETWLLYRSFLHLNSYNLVGSMTQHPSLNFLLFLDRMEGVVGTLTEGQLLIVVLLSVVEPRIGCLSILEALWTSCRWWWSIRVIWIPRLVVLVLLPLLLSFRHGGLLLPRVPQCAVVACTPTVIASVCRLF